jgi:uncharacterized membrane protein YbaN (DUF454 family)
MKLVRNPVLRHLLLALGWISVGLAILGALLPLLPTTPFLTLAVWCFVRSSEKAHAWIYRQPLLGPTLRDWEERGAIARRSKILALSMIAVSMTVIWLKIPQRGVQIGVTALLIAISIFILTRPET